MSARHSHLAFYPQPWLGLLLGGVVLQAAALNTPPAGVPPAERLCQQAAQTTDPYLATSYDACKANTDDLQGVWMVVGDYRLSYEGFKGLRTNLFANNKVSADQQQRMTMTITDNGDGTLDAFICHDDPALRHVTFSPDNGVLTLSDPVTDTSLTLHIADNVSMVGAHQSNSERKVAASSVTAIKIQSLSDDDGALGSLQLAYSLSGATTAHSELAVQCFNQRQGTYIWQYGKRVFQGEKLEVQTHVQRDGRAEDLILAVYEPDPSPPSTVEERTAVSLHFLPSGTRIAARTMDDTTLRYSQNDTHGIQLDADIIDDVQPLAKAQIQLNIAF